MSDPKALSLLSLIVVGTVLLLTYGVDTIGDAVSSAVAATIFGF